MGAGAVAGTKAAIEASSQNDLTNAMSGLSLSSRNKISQAIDEVEGPPPPPPLMLLRTISEKRHVALPGIDDAKGCDQTEDGAGLEPPELVRGYTKIDRKEDLLANLVVNAMKNKGWKNVDESTVKVKDCSGHGGSQTYKVSAEGVTPGAVALHSRSQEVAEDELSDPRMEAAAVELEKHGLVPRRLVYGGDWFIEVWEGTGQPSTETVEDAKAIGKFMAKLHKVPTDWYDIWREKLVARFATSFPEEHEAGNGLDKVAHGSHVWWYTCRKKWIHDEMDRGKREEYLKPPVFAPRSDVGQRLVTTHGDLHPGNMIQTANGVKAIDLEFTHVTWASSDLGYTMDVLKRLELKRAFLEAYLVASGFPAEASDVDAIFLDASFHRLAYHYGSMAAWRFRADQVSAWKLTIEKIVENPNAFLQAEVDFNEYVKTMPEVAAIFAKFEKEGFDKQWASLDPLPAAEPQDAPIAKLTGWHAHEEKIKCETSHFSCTLWAYLHPHQRHSSYNRQQYDAPLYLISTGYHMSPHNNGGRPFNMGICMTRTTFRFALHGNAEVPSIEAIDDGDLFDSQWHHLAFVYNAAEKFCTFYVDGKPRRTISYLNAWPLRIPDGIGAGGSPSYLVPMASYASRGADDKLLLIKVSGNERADGKYNGVYAQVQDETCNSLHCGMPFFKNKNDMYLKKYNAEAGGEGDWSFDHRRPDVTKDWCDGGWYLAAEGEELMLGKYKWDCGELTISWAELEPQKVGDEDAEASAKPPTEDSMVKFVPRNDFPEGQLHGVSLFTRCLGDAEVVEVYTREAAEDRPKPSEAPAPVVLEKVELDSIWNWEQQNTKAAELGGRLPTQVDFVLSKTEVSERDAWFPVSREDGKTDDWVQLADRVHPRYCSHTDAYGPPGWSTEAGGDGGGCRFKYFYMKK